MLIKLAVTFLFISISQLNFAASADNAAQAICQCVSQVKDFIDTAKTDLEAARDKKQYSKVHEVQIGASIMRRNAMQCLSGLIQDYPELDSDGPFAQQVLQLSQQQCGLEDLISDLN